MQEQLDIFNRAPTPEPAMVEESPPRERLRDILRGAIAWLDSPQLPRALMVHHGIQYGFGRAPFGLGIELAIDSHHRRATVIFRHGRGLSLPKNPPPDREAAVRRFDRRLVALVNGISPVEESWEHSHGVSARLAREPGADVLALVERYHRGCPKHKGDVFCGLPREGEEACGWYGRGRRLVVPPAGWW